jgi:alcohol dehydrogenase/propanol-preferring alcohol dehydrogenase
MLSYQVAVFGQPLVRTVHDTPQPQATEVVVRIGSCGVCHSDVHLHDGYFDIGNDARLDMTRAVRPPRTLGHEIAGTVVAMGPDAVGVVVGDRRVVFPWIGCGTCSLCLGGNEHLCNAPQALGVHRDGGFADHVVVPHPKYLLEYGALSEEQACTYACSGLTAYSALLKAGPIGPADPLVIIGAGGVGLSGIRLARHLYGVAPIVVEIDPDKGEIARAAGAGQIIDPRAEGAMRQLLKSTGGAAAVVDFVGAGTSFAFGFGVLRKAGKLVSVGLLGGATPIVPAILSMKAVTIIGSYVGSLAELLAVLEIAQSGALPELPLTLQPMADASDALQALRAGRVKGRVVLKPLPDQTEE